MALSIMMTENLPQKNYKTLLVLMLIKQNEFLDFTKSESNSHSAWLTFLYPRLYIAKQLLKDEGDF